MERSREYNMSEIRKKLKEKYGKLIQWQDSNNFMPINVDFDSGKISKKIEELFDLSMFKEKVLLLLNAREIGESLTVQDIKTQFYRTRGFPVVTDENLFKKAIESLINDEKVVVVSGSEVYRKGKPVMFLRDEYVIVKPEEVAEESTGVDVGPRTDIRMRMPEGTEEPYVEGEEPPVSLGDETAEPETTLTGGLGQFYLEDFVIEESTPWSLQSRLESELDEAKMIKEMSLTLTLKGKFDGKDMKNVVNEIILKHEDEMHSMKVSAKVAKNG